MKLGLPKFPKVAGTVDEFDDWETELRKKYPVRYAVAEAISLCFKPLRTAKRKLNNAYWWVQYRVNPKHKYTTIKLKKLEPGYYDEDALLFYAMFEIFETFMKRQLTDPQIVWEYDEGCFPDWMLEDDLEGVKKEIKSRNDRWKEMKDIYDWWVDVYPNRESTLPEYPTLPKEWGALACLGRKYDDEKEMIEYKRIINIHIKAEDEWEKEDEEMMIRLVKIQSSLWD